MAAARIKPFVFDNLERLSRAEVDLRAAVLRYLPDALPREQFERQVAEQLGRYSGERVTFEVTAVREPTFGKYRQSIPDPAVLFVLSADPLPGKIVLQIDFALAHIMVDRMLGGGGEYPDELRAITSIEEGVLEFLVLKILSLMAKSVVPGELQFRLDGMVTDPGQLSALGVDQEQIALVSIQMTVGKKAGFIRLALPHPLLHGFLQKLAPVERTLSSRDLARLESLNEVKVPVWIEVGTMDMAPGDLSHLEPGDVVLFDQVHIQLGAAGIEGPVVLRIREGVGGGFQGAVVESSPESIAVRIDSVF